MNLQHALEVLKLEYSSDWQDISSQLEENKELNIFQKDAKHALDQIYNSPNTPTTCRMLEDTPKELRIKFLSDAGADYLKILGETIPYIGCNNLWSELESMDVVISGSKADLLNQGTNLVTQTKEKANDLRAMLPENLNSEIIKAPSLWTLRFAANKLTSSIGKWWNNTDDTNNSESQTQQINHQLQVATPVDRSSTATVIDLLEIPDQLQPHINSPSKQPVTPNNSPTAAIQKTESQYEETEQQSSVSPTF